MAGILTAVWIATVCVVIASAQTSTLVPDARGVTAESLDAALEAAVADGELDEPTRTALVDQLRQARAHLRSRQSADAAAAAYAATVRSAPRDTQRLRAKLDESTRDASTVESLGIDERTATSVVDGALTSALVELAAAEAQLAAYDAEAAAEADRPAAIRERLAALRARGPSTAAVSPVGEPQVLGQARRLTFQLEEQARSAEVQRLEQELLSHGVRLNLLGARRDDTARQVVDTRRRVDVLQAEVNVRRQRQADRAREEAALAELAAAAEHPAIRELAQDNAELTRELPAVATEIRQISERLGQIEARAREIEQSLARSLERLELGGVNQLLGRLLVEQQRNLPHASRLRAAMRERRQTLAEVSLAQMLVEEERRELTPITLGVDRAMARIVDVSDPEERRAIGEKVELLLRNRRDLLQQMASSYASQAGVLNEVDLAQNRLLDAVSDYERFLDRNLLWIPSATLFGPESIRRLAPAVGWMLDPASWAGAFRAMSGALRHSLIGTLGALLALGLALYFRRSLAGAVIANDQPPCIRHTLAALALAALRALPLPFLLAVLAWALHRSPTLDSFSAAMGSALWASAPFLYGVLLWRTLAARDGMLRAHVGWQAERLELLRRHADRLTVLGVPLAFVSAFAYSGPTVAHAESLGRLAFILFMTLVSVAAFKLLHPTRGVVTPTNDEDAAEPLPRLVHALAVGAPLLLVLASILGYSYTAQTLAGHLVETYGLGLGLAISRLVVWRWLTLAGRGLEAGDRPADEPPSEMLERELVDADIAIIADEPVVPTPNPPDPETVDRQSKRLLDAGFAFAALLAIWAIWSPILPALGVLDRTALWPQTVIVDGEEATVPVTLADLFLALLIAGVTSIAARNLPGLMEIAVLRRATLQPGSRYAINTLLRYVIVLVGTIATFGVLGWRWSQIQWLAAAISVGLGFGLQEIVANFVSGLVLLFERPVRVGDTVTVGQITGTISRIRIRATTITDWDRKEIIVPNKSLITEQVINWTLTDPITRIVIPVGIGYGSDIEPARDVMSRALRGLPLVLDEPPPQVYFVGFGDSSLDFKLHVYARQLADRMPLIHAVHEAVLGALRDEGIEIP
ncbi:MAG: mechanosensitive ion channel domain-containing protein, partial [Acidobacteriota bacterium]